MEKYFKEEKVKHMNVSEDSSRLDGSFINVEIIGDFARVSSVQDLTGVGSRVKGGAWVAQ